jgi:hypothetical protein
VFDLCSQRRIARLDKASPLAVDDKEFASASKRRVWRLALDLVGSTTELPFHTHLRSIA